MFEVSLWNWWRKLSSLPKMKGNSVTTLMSLSAFHLKLVTGEPSFWLCRSQQERTHHLKSIFFSMLSCSCCHTWSLPCGESQWPNDRQLVPNSLHNSARGVGDSWAWDAVLGKCVQFSDCVSCGSYRWSQSSWTWWGTSWSMWHQERWEVVPC